MEKLLRYSIQTVHKNIVKGGDEGEPVSMAVYGMGVTPLINMLTDVLGN